MQQERAGTLVNVSPTLVLPMRWRPRPFCIPGHAGSLRPSVRGAWLPPRARVVRGRTTVLAPGNSASGCSLRHGAHVQAFV